MNIRLLSLFKFIFSLLLTGSSYSQSTYQFGILPSINLNKKLQKDWSLNFKTQSRQRIQNGDFRGNHTKEYEYLLTDFSILSAKKVGLNSRIAGGYLIRFRNEEIIHRTIQQYSIVKRKTGFRLAHRIAADQSFSSNQSPEFRFRYRLTPEIPLDGQTVDPKEFYIKTNLEFLNKFQSSDYELEFRLAPLFGYSFNDRNKLEFGLDYRFDSIFVTDPRHSFWTSINWYLNF